VSFLGIAGLGWLIERSIAARSAAPLVWAVPVVGLWSNAHTECVFGVLMVAMFATSEAVWPAALPRREAIRALLAAMACGVAVLANPYGWGLLRYLFENVTVPQLLGIAELQPAYLPSYRAFFAYLGLTCALLVLFARRLTLWEALAVLVFGALGVRYLRLTPLVFLVTAPMLAARLTAMTARGIDARAMLVTALAGAIFLSRVPLPALVTEFRVGSLHPETMFPSHAVQFLRDHQLNGPTFNSNNLGGWLAWSAYPDVRIFQDSRLQAYPPDHFRHIVEASRSLDAWNDLVRGVDWAMLSTPRPNALSGVGLFANANWATVYWDDAIEIVVRREGRHADLAHTREYQLLTSDSDLSGLVRLLSSADRDRVGAEARRNRAENPNAFLAAAIMCLMDDDRAACADVERLGADRPAYRRDLDLVRVLRSQR
jgi:hypothetical protein